MRSITRAHNRTQALFPMESNVVSIVLNQRTRLATLLFPFVQTQDDLLEDHQFVARVLNRYIETIRPACRQKRRK